MAEKLLIVGTGGHAKEVLDVIESLWYEVAGFLNEETAETEFRGLPVVSDPDLLDWTQVMVAIGDNEVRAEYCERFAGKLCEPLVHPSVVLSPSAVVGDGTVIMPQAHISSDVRIGRGCIVGALSYIAHDCTVGDFTHIATGCMLNGETSVGSYSLIGSGTVGRQQSVIGSHVVCGAGSVVVNTVDDGQIVAGVPAKPLPQTRI